MVNYCATYSTDNILDIEEMLFYMKKDRTAYPRISIKVVYGADSLWDSE